MPQPLCASCKTPATWALDKLIPTSTIKLDGTVHRGQQVHSTFYCDWHIKTAK